MLRIHGFHKAFWEAESAFDFFASEFNVAISLENKNSAHCISKSTKDVNVKIYGLRSLHDILLVLRYNHT